MKNKVVKGNQRNHLHPEVQGLSTDKELAIEKSLIALNAQIMPITVLISSKNNNNLKAGPIAPSVERWTPRGESTRPGKRGPGFEARRALVSWASWRVWLRLVAGRNQAKSVRGPAVRGYVCTLNIRF